MRRHIYERTHSHTCMHQANRHFIILFRFSLISSYFYSRHHSKVEDQLILWHPFFIHFFLVIFALPAEHCYKETAFRTIFKYVVHFRIFLYALPSLDAGFGDLGFYFGELRNLDGYCWEQVFTFKMKFDYVFMARDNDSKMTLKNKGK